MRKPKILMLFRRCSMVIPRWTKLKSAPVDVSNSIIYCSFPLFAAALLNGYLHIKQVPAEQAVLFFTID